MLKRCENKAEAKVAPIGYLPNAEDINVEGLDLSIETLKSLLTIDSESWLEDIVSIEEFYAKIGDTIPEELYEELKVLTDNLDENLAKIGE